MTTITERPVDHALAILRKRAQVGLNPFFSVSAAQESVAAIDQLRSPASDEWAGAFLHLASDWVTRAEEAGPGSEHAASAWMKAYDYAHIARYPCVDTPLKGDAHDRSVAYFRRAHTDRDDIEFVEVTSALGPLHCVLARPEGAGPFPLLVAVGGLDVWKEELVTVVVGPYIAAGFAVLAVDAPGTGESPVRMTPAADSLWDAILDWADTRPDLTGFRSILGTSLGGYWAARAGHTHARRFHAAINHGGPAHYSFQAEWLDRWVDRGEYPCAFTRALATVMGSADEHEFTTSLPALSLLDTGIIDSPSAPMILVNGVHDRTISPEDMYLLARHGRPKSIRLYEAGHMGFTPTTVPTIVEWLVDMTHRDRHAADVSS
ncbi:alpha/beta hydrolase family protein [Streptomyces sp. NPDC059477]|uniref:alpha/beta hydrolase family protein n=1 Tax=Streptomyces sp. NPDC059477 TaxID=3346847 RepID=UPI00369BAFC6